ncbi:MAG TPA: glycosyltransferase [Thermoanaerobaculia bacterium]|nr:glycosyltransferase [Thermoanaerobaculia bacterium]
MVTITAVVPTIGRSRWLVPCLEALRRQQGPPLELLVVDQALAPLDLPDGLADRVVRPGCNRGFAGGTNFGLALAAGELVATVNDDALVEPGWLAALAAALAADPQAAAAQGVNLALAAPAIADGCGLTWNRWWQAVQVGHGEAAPPAGGPVREVFGVSATAALFRRAALDRVARDGAFFDPRLRTYYEDAELAGRLRAAGFRALLVPGARVRHAGSASVVTASASRGRWRLIYGNRYLAAARLLGGRFWPRLPRMAARDLLDLAAAARRADLPRLAGIAAGWGRALRHLPAFARRGAPALPLEQIEGRRR